LCVVWKHSLLTASKNGAVVQDFWASGWKRRSVVCDTFARVRVAPYFWLPGCHEMRRQGKSGGTEKGRRSLACCGDRDGFIEGAPLGGFSRIAHTYPRINSSLTINIRLLPPQILPPLFLVGRFSLGSLMPLLFLIRQ
jgi:hypothetical protein